MPSTDKCIRKGCTRRKAPGTHFTACSALCRRAHDMSQEAINLASAFPSEQTDAYYQQVSELNRLITSTAKARGELRKLWHEAGLPNELWDQISRGDWVPEDIGSKRAGDTAEPIKPCVSEDVGNQPSLVEASG